MHSNAFFVRATVVSAILTVVACGGSVQTGDGEPGQDGGVGGTQAGAGGTGKGGWGGAGGANAGAGGTCVDTSCGPSHADCCNVGSACMNGLNENCSCYPDHKWQCYPIGDGGSAGVGGSPCTPCGPDWAPCCSPGAACGNGSTTCSCGGDAYWHCFGSGGAAGAGGCTACGPDWAPCCNPGVGCAMGSMSCNCGGDWTWHCSGTGGAGGGCVDPGCGPNGSPCCYPGSGCATPYGSCNCGYDAIWHCSGGAGGSAGAGGSVGCDPNNCAWPFACCGNTCVNPLNDPSHCGSCTSACASIPETSPYCSGGTCSTPPCWGTGCTPGTFCCGQSCCKYGQLCCDVQTGGPYSGPTCHTPTAAEPTCPKGCPLCN